MSAAPADRFALVAGEWFDGEARHAAGPVTLRVESGRLAAVDAGDHTAALAAQGWAVERVPFVMPGLVDTHVHLFLDGAATDAAVRIAHLKQGVDALTGAARTNAQQALRCGVTCVRDAGDRYGINNALRAEARTDIRLAQVRSSGLGVRRPERYGVFMATEVGAADNIRTTVERLAIDNDEIKLILTGIIDFEAGAVTDEPQFDAADAALVVRTAHTCGRKVLAHCSGARGLAIAVEAGVDSIEHGFFMSRAILERMRERDLAWTPTFSPVHFQWAHPQVAGWSAQTVGNLRRILDAHAEHLRLARSLGVRVLVGTDAGSVGVAHGSAIYDEMDRFVESGWTAGEVLTAVTAGNRRHFGAQHPRLAPGAPFDAIGLEETPFADLKVLRRPRVVWRAGRWIGAA